MAFPANLVETFRKIVGPDAVSVLGPFTLESLQGFPYTDWTSMQEKYADLKKWYDGSALDEKLINETTGEEVDKYPIHLNPIPNTCEKHTIILLGNTLESIRQGNLPIRYTIIEKEKDGKKTGTKAEDDPNLDIIENALVESFKEHGAGAMFVSNGITSQYLGGCVFGVSFEVGVEDGEKIKKIHVFRPRQTEFLGIPAGGNPWDLREAWFIREISADEASGYGYPVRPMDNAFFYIEKWTKDEYYIKINNHTLTTELPNGEEFRYEGENPYGLVPFVYIPHIRVDNFYGDSVINKAIKGLVKEMNLRFADTGDAISDDSHSEIAVRQVRDQLKPVTLPSGKVVTDLGTSAGLGASERDPDMFAVNTASTSEPMLKFGDKLVNQYRKEARHPAVADGEDEGSQRSSLTLTTRMWPLVAHVDLERINWTTGLIKLAGIILKMCEIKGVYGIEKKHLQNYEINIRWALTLPRDREELVNEIAIRKKNHLGSLRHLLSLFDDIDDVDDEIAAIKAEIEEEAERVRESQLDDNENGDGDSTTGKTSTAEPNPKANNRVKRESE